MRLFLLVVALVLAVCCVLDSVFGLLRWQGLRVTARHPAIMLLAGAASATIAAAILARASFPTAAPTFLFAAIPLYVVAAVWLNRSLLPVPWMCPGSYGEHIVLRVDLAASDGAVPALLFEPCGPARGAVVVVHGAGAHKTFYTWPVIDALLQARFVVCALDLDGHGDNMRMLDFPGVVEDVAVAVTYLRTRWDFVAVCGISLGGCVAARGVAEGIASDALALFEAPISVEVTPVVRRHEYWTLARVATWQLHRYAGTLPLARSWATAPVRTRVGTLDLIERLDLLGSLGAIRIPLWLCYGGSDLVVPLEQVERIRQAAPAGTPLRIVPRATHLSLPLEPGSLRELTRWLSDVQERDTTRDNAAIHHAERDYDLPARA